MRVYRCQCAVSARDDSGAGERVRRRRDLQCLLSSKVFDEGRGRGGGGGVVASTASICEVKDNIEL